MLFVGKFFGNNTQNFHADMVTMLRSFCTVECRIMIKVGYLVCVRVLAICFAELRNTTYVCMHVVCFVECD